MAPKALLVLAGVLLVGFLLVSSEASASAVEEQKQLSPRWPPPPPPRRACRCCWPYGGPCLQFCCFNGEVISVPNVESKEEPRN